MAVINRIADFHTDMMPWRRGAPILRERPV